jgi:hypothetical protein
MQKTPLAAPQVFRPVIDWWVAAIVVFLIIVVAAGIPLVLWSAPITRWGGLLVALVLAAYVLYLIDLAFYSVYILDNNELIITSHLRHAAFPYRLMRALQPGGFWALFSVAHQKRFALSRKNVIIKLASGPWKTISVSPRDRDAFINQILERIDHERSRRAARQPRATAA